MSYFLVDIDGTLADCAHRKKLLPSGRMDWAHFLHPSLVIQDDPIEPIMKIVHGLIATDTLVAFVSGRPESLRRTTITWLYIHGLLDVHDSDETSRLYLHMRPDNDFRPDHIIKSEILDRLEAEHGPPLCVIDDRPSVLEMWRARNLFVLPVPTSMTE